MIGRLSGKVGRFFLPEAGAEGLVFVVFSPLSKDKAALRMRVEITLISRLFFLFFPPDHNRCASFLLGAQVYANSELNVIVRLSCPLWYKYLAVPPCSPLHPDASPVHSQTSPH